MAKKITAIVSLSIIGILMLFTIIMANIKVNHSINCAEPAEVWMYSSSPSSNSSGQKASEEQAEAIKDYIATASEERSLTALFNGTLFAKAELNKRNSSTSIPSPSNGGFTYYVCYKYSTAQTLMDGNNAFTDEDGERYYYKELYFGVSNVDGVSEFTVYVNPWSSNSTYTYLYFYTLTADFGDLYEYVNGIIGK